VLVVAGTAIVRWRLLDVPLDRDEGEYAWLGSLLLDGTPPYAHAYHMKMPGIYLVYALALAAFGSTVAAVHLGLLVANALATVLVFWLGRRLFDDAVAVAAAAIFAIASLNPEIHGLAAYAEHFVVPAVLMAALALVTALDSGRPWQFGLAGLLFGTAFIVKQSGGLFGLVAFGAIGAQVLGGGLTRRAAIRALIAGTVAAAVPLALVTLWLAHAGTLDNFWFWTFRYAAEYATLQSPAAAARMLASTAADIVPGAWPVLVLALVGLAALLRGAGSAHARAFMLLFLAASCVAVSAGLYYRHQYFLLLLPAASLLAGFGALVAANALPWPRHRAWAATALVALPVVWQLAWQSTIFFRAAPAAVSRSIYGRNPFPESVEVARYIRERTRDREPIVVMGSEPQIYFYARRPAATGYIYMYPLMEPQPFALRMQEDLIREVEAARPTYLVHVNLRASWLATPASHPRLRQWFDGYVRQFERVGVADVVSRDVTHYRWDAAARDYVPESPIWIAVYRRIH
jgi:4-amino-4-deoxy-L-arabinose transferase-like glycosyltransferase